MHLVSRDEGLHIRWFRPFCQQMGVPYDHAPRFARTILL